MNLYITKSSTDFLYPVIVKYMHGKELRQNETAWKRTNFAIAFALCFVGSTVLQLSEKWNRTWYMRLTLLQCIIFMYFLRLLVPHAAVICFFQEEKRYRFFYSNGHYLGNFRHAVSNSNLRCSKSDNVLGRSTRLCFIPSLCLLGT